MTPLSLKSTCIALIGTLVGCATAPPISLSSAGSKRIAVAQPQKMHDGLFLNFASNHFRAEPAYRAFCDALKAELHAKGFVVLDYCSRPNTAVIGAIYPVPSVGPDEADFILVPMVELGYFAGFMERSFSIQSNGHFILIDTKSRTEVAMRSAGRPVAEVASSKYESQDALISDMPNAMAALTAAGVDLGKRIAKTIE